MFWNYYWTEKCLQNWKSLILKRGWTLRIGSELNVYCRCGICKVNKNISFLQFYRNIQEYQSVWYENVLSLCTGIDQREKTVSGLTTEPIPTDIHYLTTKMFLTKILLKLSITLKSVWDFWEDLEHSQKYSLQKFQ